MSLSVGVVKFLPIFMLYLLLPSCALITTPVKVVGKATTTTMGLAGKAAGAGIDAMSSDDDEDEKSGD